MLPFSLLASYSEEVFDADGETLGFLYGKVWTEYAQSSLMTVFLWIAALLSVSLLGAGILVRFKRQESLKSYVTVALSLAVGFSLTVIIAMLSLAFMEMNEKGRINELLLYPAATLAGTVLLGAAVTYGASLFGKKPFRIAATVSAGLAAAAFVALLVCIGVYYGRNIDGDGYFNSDAAKVNQIVLYLSAALLLAAIFALGFVFNRDKKGFDSKSISYAAICIALSFALSYLKLWEMPQGGSITFASLLPLMIYSYMFGTKKGVFAGLIYGVLQAVQDPWIIHPAQFLLDYPVAFAGIGVAGMFSNVKKLKKLPQVQFALGAVAASTLRFVSHVLSGVFAFSAYAADAGMNVWAYSLAYNSFVFVDVALVIIAGVLAFSSPSLVKQARKFHAVENVKKEQTYQINNDENT